MYIYLYTDKSVSRDGFELTYSINKCPLNCSNNATQTNGVCNSGRCECIGSQTGSACQYAACGGNVCNQAIGSGICNVVCIFILWFEHVSSRPSV